MNRIQMLISQIDCIDQMMTARIQNEREYLKDQYFSNLAATHQKVSIAEKYYGVKNTCSPFTSELNSFLIE